MDIWSELRNLPLSNIWIAINNVMLQKWILSLAGCLLLFSVDGQKDISWDIKTGNELAVKIEKTVGIVHWPNAEKTVKDIGNHLVEQLTANPFVFSFQIIDQQEPNAFALPGGHVYISRGLMALIIPLYDSPLYSIFKHMCTRLFG